MNIADLDFLTPGSTFVREDGRESRFLFLTNTALPKKVRAQHPPQVVYADENNNILSCSIDRFLEKRQFHAVDPELESRLVNLLVSSESEEDELDLDGDDALVIEDGEDAPVGDGPVDSDEGVQDEGPGPDDTPLVKFIPSSEQPTALDADYLAQAVSSYQQSPGTALGSVQHALFIRAEQGITRDSLISVFSPSSEKTGNSIYTFEVEIEGVQVHVNWNEFLGVYPCVFYGSQMYQVLFNTFAETAAQSASEKETDYLMSSPANAAHLERSLAQARAGEAQTRELIDASDDEPTNVEFVEAAVESEQQAVSLAPVTAE